MGSDIEQRRSVLRSRFETWVPRTLDGWLAHCADEYGERPFVITGQRTVGYREVAAWAATLADGLAALGVRRGDRVGLLMANHLEFVPLKFAIAAAGAVAIPFNYLYRQEELAYVLAQSECSVLITMSEFGGLDYPAMLDAIAPGWELGAPEQLPSLRHVVVLPGEGWHRDGVRTVEGLAELGAANPGAADDASAKPDDVGDILYTSGTTGAPKGVLVTHDAVQRTAYASALTRAFEDGRRILFSLPCYHMFGYVEGLLAAMVVGGAIIPQPAFDPVRYLEGIERHRATDILCVPTMTVALLEHPRRKEFDLSSLNAVLSGAAPAPVWLWERVRDELGATEIVTGYGMTECGGAMTLSLPEDDLTYASVTVGRPKLAGAAGVEDADAITQYKTIDPETGHDLPPHTEGELASHGPTHMLGFWRKPDETAKAIAGGWVRSGDLGRVREDGYLELTGRSKELYKSGGELVMPKEIEELLSRHDGVSQVYAIGVPDERWGDAGCVCIVRAPEVEITEDVVIALCKEKLARFKVPKHVVFLAADELPTTPTGKVQKFRLVKLAQERLAAAGTRENETDKVEATP
ncbi:class I adenylate-forming enzyme family protein [Amycolatopsis echigonensis]|uniref:AMP-binding protein n=1 Tax=Amycolatopsis echigonensis TaxID=2576905 RepID=A0A8E1W6W7_9PSEU|nr:AMP-binding protein [Amycolatopsis echigonensis]MBB2504936.1 AMP-binding protein [Amycolatopsis echigonensis]